MVERREPLLVEYYRKGSWFSTKDQTDMKSWYDEALKALAATPERYWYPPSHKGRVRISYMDK